MSSDNFLAPPGRKRRSKSAVDQNNNNKNDEEKKEEVKIPVIRKPLPRRKCYQIRKVPKILSTLKEETTDEIFNDVMDTLSYQLQRIHISNQTRTNIRIQNTFHVNCIQSFDRDFNKAMDYLSDAMAKLSLNDNYNSKISAILKECKVPTKNTCSLDMLDDLCKSLQNAYAIDNQEQASCSKNYFSRNY